MTQSAAGYWVEGYFHVHVFQTMKEINKTCQKKIFMSRPAFCVKFSDRQKKNSIMIPYKPNPFLSERPRESSDVSDVSDVSQASQADEPAVSNSAKEGGARRTVLSANPSINDLLNWSIENRSEEPSGAAASGPSADWLDVIMGKEDSVKLKELLAVITDVKAEEDDRLEAAETFLELIEDVNNANNLLALKMWKPLISLLDPSTNPSAALRAHAAWIVSMAVQNNEVAQSHALANDLVSHLLLFLEKDSDWLVRLKLVSAISSLVRNNPPGLKLFTEKRGFNALFQLLFQLEALAQKPPDGDDDTSVKSSHTIALKILFFLTSLLSENTDDVNAKTELVQGWVDSGLIEAVVTVVQRALFTKDGQIATQDYEKSELVNQAVLLLEGVLEQNGVKLQDAQKTLIKDNLLPILHSVVNTDRLQGLLCKV